MGMETEGYEGEFSAEEKCKTYADDLKEILNDKLKGSFCIGFHLRQVFDTSAPSVGLYEFPEDHHPKAQDIKDKNKEYGLQTLNQVLDTLYYRRKEDKDKQAAEQSKEQPKKLCIRVDYLHTPKAEHTCHTFDRLKEFKTEDNKWEHAHYAVKKASFDATELEKVGDFTSGKLARQLDGYRGGGTKFLFNDYTCGSEKLCNDLQIDHSLSAYRVITAAIYQLGRYACNENNENPLFGPQTVTLLIRPDSPFSVVVGVTIIANLNDENNDSDSVIKAAKAFLEEKSNSLKNHSTYPCNFRELFGDGKSPESLWAYSYAESCYTSKHQTEITTSLCEKILDQSPITFGDVSWPVALKHVLDAFLYTTHSFCGERLEGHPLCFGFILGNPGLLTHTPREHPILLEYVSSDGPAFFSLTELMKKVHLISFPWERATVLPYYQGTQGSSHDPKLAAYLLEFDEAMEEFRARPWAPLWCEQFIPYLYYTERFPWAVATVAGPGADFRVFAGGELVAYHSEKGWHKIDRKDFIENLHCENKANMNEDIAAGIVDVALQMPRFVNPNAKGGILVYLAKKIPSLSDYFSPLTSYEPVRSNGKKWLTGMPLLTKTGSERKLDYSVAHTLLQATLLDGAVVLQKKNVEGEISLVEVELFSQRVIRKEGKQSSNGDASGTKHAAAEVLMKEPNIPVGSVAIAVSSDGPITVWFRSNDAAGNAINGKPFYIGKLMRKTS